MHAVISSGNYPPSRPVIIRWNTRERKTQNKISGSTNTFTAALSFPQCWFSRFCLRVGENVCQINIERRGSEEIGKCFNNYGWECKNQLSARRATVETSRKRPLKMRWISGWLKESNKRWSFPSWGPDTYPYWKIIFCGKFQSYDMWRSIYSLKVLGILWVA